MSHRLDKLFREKAEEASYPFNEEYKEEAAALWDRLDARRQNRWWTLLILVLLLGLLTGFVWYTIEQSESKTDQPVVETSSHTEGKKQVPTTSIEKDKTTDEPTMLFSGNSGYQGMPDDEREDRKVKTGPAGQHEEKPSKTDQTPQALATKKKSGRLFNSVELNQFTEQDIREAVPERTEGSGEQRSAIASIPDRMSTLRPLPHLKSNLLNIDATEALEETALSSGPRSPVFTVDAAAIYATDQFGVDIGSSAAWPVGSALYAGVGLGVQIIDLQNQSNYRVDQTFYDLGSVRNQYDISLGPRLELSAHAWFGWRLNRHLLSLGVGAARTLALSSDWTVDRTIVASEDQIHFEQDQDIQTEPGRHWVDLDQAKLKPFTELSYAFRLTPRLSMDITYRKFFNTNPPLKNLEDTYAGVGGQPANEGGSIWNEDPNRFSFGIQYQINR